MKFFRKIYNALEPSLRGLAFMLFAVLINIKYDTWVNFDSNSTIQPKSKMVLFIFSKIDQLGGKALLLGIFIGIGFLIIINDYLKKIK